MDSPVIGHKPTRIGLNRHRRKPDVGFFNDNESLDANDDQFEDPWLNITSRHPELANLRPWGTWGARKRRGSAAGNERPTVAPENTEDPRERYIRDSFFEDLPQEFRGHIPTRWSPRFDPEDQVGFSHSLPRHEYHHHRPEPQPESPHSSINKSTQTPTEEKDIRPNLTQHGLRNTVDLGQKTAAESDQLDATTARNTRSMSAPPGRRFSSPLRQNQMGNTGNGNPPPAAATQTDPANSNKQPAVRVIPIFVEGRDEPVINESQEPVPNPEEPKHSTQFQDEFFSNHNVPHGFQQTPKGFAGRQHSPSSFGFGRKFGQQQEPFHQGGMFKRGPPQPAQSKNATEDVRQNEQHAPAQNVPQQQNIPPPQAPQPQPPPQISDPITKIQLIQKDVLELMTQLENFTGKSKKDKEYIYLDEMLTRNLLKLDVIDTEGKESIRSARKEAIKCIEKCIAVLEAKAESGNNSEVQNAESSKEEDSENVTNGSVSKSNSMETNQPANRDKCDENNKLGASDMDVDNAAGLGNKDSATSGAGDSMQVEKNDTNNAEMDVDRSSQ